MRKADPRSWAFLRTPSQLSVSGIPSPTFLFFRREAPRLSFFLQCIRIPAFNESLSKGVRVEVGLRSGLLDSTDSSSRLVYSTPASVIHLVISFVSDDSAIRMNCWRNSTFKTGNPESDEILSFIHYNFFALIQKIGSNWLLNKAQETSWSTSHPLLLVSYYFAPSPASTPPRVRIKGWLGKRRRLRAHWFISPSNQIGQSKESFLFLSDLSRPEPASCQPILARYAK